ncbi:MAG: hypothetical protein ACRCS9_14710 [Hyphomicrobium sp.]
MMQQDVNFGPRGALSGAWLGWLFAGLALALTATGAIAGQPKLDKEACDQLKADQVRFVDSGILADLQRGAEWGSANLSAERLREVQHYIMLDEQLKFACRQVTLTLDAERAGEAAKELEFNPNALDSSKPAAGAGAAGTGAAGTRTDGESPDQLGVPGRVSPTPTPSQKTSKARPAESAPAPPVIIEPAPANVKPPKASGAAAKASPAPTQAPTPAAGQGAAEPASNAAATDAAKPAPKAAATAGAPKPAPVKPAPAAVRSETASQKRKANDAYTPSNPSEFGLQGTQP